jgi:hypothetical protein
LPWHQVLPPKPYSSFQPPHPGNGPGKYTGEHFHIAKTFASPQVNRLTDIFVRLRRMCVGSQKGWINAPGICKLETQIQLKFETQDQSVLLCSFCQINREKKIWHQSIQWWLGVVVHACDSSYSGGRGKRIMVQGLIKQKKETLS